eukprot:GHVL01008902.1.p1 GENE.GHVL01008902.1~~GHVL01008902.1.p1  ORF type:complete len:652 (+),score=122.88 GHVL01008902.1:386-2341(+)
MKKKQKLENWRKTQKMLGKTWTNQYKKWEFWEPSEDEHEPVLPEDNPQFKQLEKQMSDDSKARIERSIIARRCKEKGNEFIRRGDPLSAISAYEDGLEKKKDIKELWTNKALAELQVNRFENAIESCNNALELAEVFEEGYSKSRNLCFKAFCRRSKGHYYLFEYSKALDDIKQALLLIEDDDAKEWFEQCNNASKESSWENDIYAEQNNKDKIYEILDKEDEWEIKLGFTNVSCVSQFKEESDWINFFKHLEKYEMAVKWFCCNRQKKPLLSLINKLSITVTKLVNGQSSCDLIGRYLQTIMFIIETSDFFCRLCESSIEPIIKYFAIEENECNRLLTVNILREMSIRSRKELVHQMGRPCMPDIIEKIIFLHKREIYAFSATSLLTNLSLTSQIRDAVKPYSHDLIRQIFNEPCMDVSVMLGVNLSLNPQNHQFFSIDILLKKLKESCVDSETMNNILAIMSNISTENINILLNNSLQKELLRCCVDGKGVVLERGFSVFSRVLKHQLRIDVSLDDLIEPLTIAIQQTSCSATRLATVLITKLNIPQDLATKLEDAAMLALVKETKKNDKNKGNLFLILAKIAEKHEKDSTRDMKPFIKIAIDSVRDDSKEVRKNASIALAKIAMLPEYKTIIRKLGGIHALMSVMKSE